MTFQTHLEKEVTLGTKRFIGVTSLLERDYRAVAVELNTFCKVLGHEMRRCKDMKLIDMMLTIQHRQKHIRKLANRFKQRADRIQKNGKAIQS